MLPMNVFRDEYCEKKKGVKNKFDQRRNISQNRNKMMISEREKGRKVEEREKKKKEIKEGFNEGTITKID